MNVNLICPNINILHVQTTESYVVHITMQGSHDVENDVDMITHTCNAIEVAL